MVIAARDTRIKIKRHNEQGKKRDKWKLVVSHFIYIYTSTVDYRLIIKKKNTNFGRYWWFHFTDGHGAAVVK